MFDAALARQNPSCVNHKTKKPWAWQTAEAHPLQWSTAKGIASIQTKKVVNPCSGCLAGSLSFVPLPEKLPEQGDSPKKRRTLNPTESKPSLVPVWTPRYVQGIGIGCMSSCMFKERFWATHKRFCTSLVHNGPKMPKVLEKGQNHWKCKTRKNHIVRKFCTPVWMTEDSRACFGATWAPNRPSHLAY